jgi:subtilisin family serine protease
MQGMIPISRIRGRSVMVGHCDPSNKTRFFLAIFVSTLLFYCGLGHAQVFVPNELNIKLSRDIVKGGNADDFIAYLAQGLTESVTYAGDDVEVVIVKLFAEGNPESELARWYKIRFVTEAVVDLDEIQGRLLERYDGIVACEKDFLTRSRADPNDPAIGQMTYDYYALIGAYDAWDVEKGSEDVIVAVIDSGVDVNHPDLVNRFVSPALFKRYPPDYPIDPSKPLVLCDSYKGKTYCFDIYVDPTELDGGILPPENDVRDVLPHGTPIAGIICGNHNSIGVPGIAPGCKILPIKANYLVRYVEQTGRVKPYTQGTSTTGTIASAIEYAASKGADVVNLSMSTPNKSQILKDAIDEACEEYNCIFIAPADNEAEEAEGYPAAYNNVIGTTAVKVNARNKIVLRDTAQYGIWIDVVAPGDNILSLVPNSTDFEAISGTSLSVPFVSGLAALIRSRDSGFTVHTFRQLLQETSTAIDDPLFDQKKMGYGLINLKLALDRLDDHAWDYNVVTQQGYPSSSSSSGGFTFGGFYGYPYAPGFYLYPYGISSGFGSYGGVSGLFAGAYSPYPQQSAYPGGFGFPGIQYTQTSQQPFSGSGYYYIPQYRQGYGQYFGGFGFPTPFYQTDIYGSPSYLSFSPFASGFQQWNTLGGFGIRPSFFGGFSGFPYSIFGISSPK